MNHQFQDAPADPLAAATHPDPYPYYARLCAERPWYRDARLQLWIASGAGVVAQVLASEHCHVRPAGEPVPRVLGDSAAAAIFRLLVRMHDGVEHQRSKRALAGALTCLQPQAIAAAARRTAIDASGEWRPCAQPAALTRFMFAVPVRTVAMLLGVPAERISMVAEAAAAFATSITPTASAVDIEQGASAAAALLEEFHALLTTQRVQSSGALLHTLARELGGAGADDQRIVANAIGLLSQSFEATAGLIGNSLLALARDPKLLDAVRATPALLDSLIQRVLHLDPPTQSTRRFVVRADNIAGQSLQPGDAILVMLAAAAREACSLPPAGELLLQDWSRAPGNFGAGRHMCPAGSVAALIAREAIAHLLDTGLELRELTARYRYRTSNHIRMPLFG